MDSNRTHIANQRVRLQRKSIYSFLEGVESKLYEKKKIFISNVNQKESGKWRNLRRLWGRSSESPRGVQIRYKLRKSQEKQKI